MRNVMPPVYFFLIDVSTDAVQTGATGAACSAIMQVISDLLVSSSVSLCVGFSDLERAEVSFISDAFLFLYQSILRVVKQTAIVNQKCDYQELSKRMLQQLAFPSICSALNLVHICLVNVYFISSK